MSDGHFKIIFMTRVHSDYVHIKSLDNILGQLSQNWQVRIIKYIYNVYYVINNICNTEMDGKIVIYADETCLLFNDTSWNLVHKKALKFKELNSTKNYDKL